MKLEGSAEEECECESLVTRRPISHSDTFIPATKLWRGLVFPFRELKPQTLLILFTTASLRSVASVVFSKFIVLLST